MFAVTANYFLAVIARAYARGNPKDVDFYKRMDCRPPRCTRG